MEDKENEAYISPEEDKYWENLYARI